MNGKRFCLEPLESEDPGFSVCLDSLEAARRLFQPVLAETLMAEAHQSKRRLRSVERERHEEREEVEKLVNSTLNLASTLDEENHALKKALSEADQKAREDEQIVLQYRCSVCLNAKVSVVLLPCQHACCCTTCWRTVSEKHGPFALCPLCRKKTVASLEMRV